MEATGLAGLLRIDRTMADYLLCVHGPASSHTPLSAVDNKPTFLEGKDREASAYNKKGHTTHVFGGEGP